MADEYQDEAAGAERAFEGLRAEIAVMRRAVEALPGDWDRQWQDNRQPDYSPDLGRVVKGLTSVEKRLEAIEAQPALRQTPEGYAARIENAGQSVIRTAERTLQQAAIETAQTGRQLAGMIGQMRGKKNQRAELLWIGISAALGVFILTLAGAPILYRHLPFGWNQRVAAAVMSTDRWDAGIKLMRKSDPASWNRMVADWSLLTGDKINAKAIAACQEEAAKADKPQGCQIMVPAGK